MTNGLIHKLQVFFYKTGVKLFGGRGLNKIWPIGKIRDWLGEASKNNRRESIGLRGHTIFLDANDSLELSIWGDELYAPEIDTIERSITEGDVVLDIGANIGLITLSMAKKVGKSGKVFAFEPDPTNVSLLTKNVVTNHYKNVVISQKAVSNKQGTIKLFLSDYNLGDHRIYDPHEKIKDFGESSAVYDRLKSSARRESIAVNAIVLDTFFENQDTSINFVKIDVQGAEGGVLEGMIGILKKNRDIKVLTEFWPAGLKMFGQDASQLLSLMGSLGFTCYEMDEKRGLIDRSVHHRYLLEKYTVQNNLTGYLFFKRK